LAGQRDLPTLFLRTEGAVLLALATFLYARKEGGWLLFLVLLLAPDVGILGYVRGTRVGAVVYNVFHTYLPPAALAVIGILSGSRLPVLIAPDLVRPGMDPHAGLRVEAHDRLPGHPPGADRPG
jgi:hypothetical protein